MTTCAITPTTLTKNEYLTTLIKENDKLKISNIKLYRRTLNLKRKNSRLKKMFNATYSKEYNETLKTDLDKGNPKNESGNDTNESVLTDVIWEDVNDLIKSYENEDKQ